MALLVPDSWPCSVTSALWSRVEIAADPLLQEDPHLYMFSCNANAGILGASAGSLFGVGHFHSQ